MPDKINPIRNTDKEAIATAQTLLRQAKTCALAHIDPETGWPSVTRAALALTKDDHPMSLISDLSAHTQALRADPRAALLIGDPEPRGDRLNQPRITLQGAARFVARDHAEFAGLRATYLAHLPKSKLYIDFADFSIVVFSWTVAHLNAGFGKAYRLEPSDFGTGHKA